MQQVKQTGLPRPVDVVRLTASLCGIVCFLMPAVFAKLPAFAAQALSAAGYALWGALALEAAVRLARMDKEERRHFLKLHKSDLVFCLATLVCLPAGLLTGAAALKCVILLKIPGALLPFNDEKVFQTIVNIVTVVLIVLFIFPFFNVVAVSLSSPDKIVNLFPEQIDLYSVQYVLTDTGFFKSMGVSIFVTAVGTTLSVLSMAMAAYPLSKPRMPLRRSMMMFFVVVKMCIRDRS